MELREAFDIADADKGGALELDEVSYTFIICLILYIVVHWCFRRNFSQKYERQTAELTLYENWCRFKWFGRMAWIHELYAPWKLDSFLNEVRAFRLYLANWKICQRRSCSYAKYDSWRAIEMSSRHDYMHSYHISRLATEIKARRWRPEHWCL